MICALDWLSSGEGTKISMSPPICCGLTLNMNHSITMSSLISTGRGLSPENQGRELEPAPRRMEWLCSSQTPGVCKYVMGFAGWAATLLGHRPSWVTGLVVILFPSIGTCGFWICLVLWPVQSDEKLGKGMLQMFLESWV